MISIHNLNYRYSRKKSLFNGLSLTMRAGSIYGLLGKNGAGKSTLMKTMIGLLFPTQGTCFVNDFEPRKRESTLLEQLFFIPEEFQLPPVSIDRFIQIYAPFYPSFKQSDFESYLKEFAMDTNHRFDQLSFGQKKKIFIAFGLATNTRLLVMDEPTNGLDIPSKVQFRKIMSQASRPDKLILLSTHQVRDLDDLITSVIIMDNSQILLHQEKEQIVQRLGFYPVAEQKDQILYEEETPNGRIALCKRQDDRPTYIDLEILFNATLTNPELISSVFKQNKI
ncbi:MAG: ABC transporter ATP-binding protein [Bacteroidota bacterium]